MDKKETKVKIKRSRAPSSKYDGKVQDKPIKIKLTAKESHTAHHSGSEDEDEPEAAVEEHLILRLPAGDMCDRLHDYVRRREIPDDIKLHLKDNRRGYFHFAGRKYDTTLVDLPTIIESQKTLDKKQFYKIADISQAIEEVEREVERLLEVDATAEDVQYEVVDNREMEMEMESDAGTQDIDIDESEAESESDEDLAAAIDRDLEEMDEDEDDNEDDEEEEDDGEEEEDEEEGGKTGEIEQKQQEIAEIKQAIQRKTRDLVTAPNAILKKRFETSIENLKKQLTLKEAHLAEMSK
ncbi:hypothetical protein DFQ28_006903 [Apophysomyces sp. BC1034]|nr:hypothetical protein DFQ30_006108 [Apophysomyces sp. BC1015]KAG0173909.1 hypothetical protein DFQ29_007676 [Apophysomyces sp. BC1021]KAG0187083.1 hypothetical protein DFQ28_006903 [Apophysomyces sp. BC1034]